MKILKSIHFYLLSGILLLISITNLKIVDAKVLYIAERYNGNIVKIDTVNGETEIVASGLGGLTGATFDRRGRLFVSRCDAGTVSYVDLLNHNFLDIVTGFNCPHGLFSDPNTDTLYLAGYVDGAVYRISEVSPNNWEVDIVADGLSIPVGTYLIDNRLYITDKKRQKLYVKDFVINVLIEVVDLPSGGTIIDREENGDLIVGTSLDTVYRVNLENGEIVATYSSFANPIGIVVDADDNSVLVCEHGGSKITHLNLDTNQRSVVTTFVDTPWQPAFQATRLWNPENGHYYEFVPAYITWLQARKIAENLNYANLPGYLATITSQSEQSFVEQLLDGISIPHSGDYPQIWIGGNDSGEQGNWKWVTGPEAGTQFWHGDYNGYPIGGAFTNWETLNGIRRQPDGGGEDYLSIEFNPTPGSFPSEGKYQWNDSSASRIGVGYLVEYSRFTVEIPELGDLNKDGDVDAKDYHEFRKTLGKCEGDTYFNSEADYDEDGCISYRDFRIWYGHYLDYSE
jgi:sugar lactone lactonase YvrE